MNILAIETSCETASIALVVGKTQCQQVLEGHRNHSERLLVSVREMLAQAEMPLCALDGIAFGSGPGMFTGLRLACAVAQGLAMGADLAVVPICSLTALSMQASSALALVATDARMGEVYSASFRLCHGQAEMLSSPCCGAPQRLRLGSAGKWQVLGSAFRVYPEILTNFTAANLMGVLDAAMPQAVDVARLAAVELKAGRALPPEQAAPLYVRNKVALTSCERQQQGMRI